MGLILNLKNPTILPGYFSFSFTQISENMGNGQDIYFSLSYCLFLITLLIKECINERSVKPCF